MNRNIRLKTMLCASDSLLGIGNDGNYFKIKVGDLKTNLGVEEIAAESIQVQYSTNKDSWHDTYTEGDKYMRIKCGSQEWSNPICIKVSAYEIWKEHSAANGTVEEFLESLRGHDGEDADGSTIRIEDLADYSEFMQRIQQLIVSNTRPLASSLASIQESMANATTGSPSSPLRVIKLTGLQNGKNVTFDTENSYVPGTARLYLNGTQLERDKDYLETDEAITLLTHLPTEEDILVFIAVQSN